LAEESRLKRMWAQRDLIGSDEATDKEVEYATKCQSHDGTGEDDNIVWHAEVWGGKRKENAGSPEINRRSSSAVIFFV